MNQILVPVISIDTIERFLRQPPPRSVPADIRRRALRARASHGIGVIGIVFLLISGPLLAVIFPWRMADDLRLNARGVSTPDAFIERRERTGMRENEQRVYRFHFQYAAADGVRRSAVCYATEDGPSEGDAAIAEYLPDQPEIARIRGCRRSLSSMAAALVAIFPAVGAGFILVARLSRRRTLSLLTHGRFATGRIRSLTNTHVQVNGRTLFKVAVALDGGDHDTTAAFYVSGPLLELARRKQQSAAAIGLLVDPEKPNRAFFVNPLAEP